MSLVPFFDLGGLVRSESAELHARLDEVIASGYFVGGPATTQFEQDFASFVGVDHCVGVGNGLDALRLILEGLGIGVGDEVIVPAFTYYATWLAVTQTGAVPVPVDVVACSANLDPAALESAITERTRAVIAVHLYGQAAEMTAILAITRKRGLRLVEDAAQSHGSVSDAGMTGSVGDAAGFSFYPTKNLGALGDGGAVTTSDAELAAKVRSRRSYGQGASKYDHVDTGWNSRLDPIQASFLSLHMTKLGEWTKRRRQIAQTYLSALGDRDVSVVGPPDIDRSVWHHFVLKANSREDLQRYLTSKGVESDIHYPYAVHEIASMRSLMNKAGNAGVFPVAEDLARRVTSLPIGPWMSAGQVDQVATALEAMPSELLSL